MLYKIVPISSHDQDVRDAHRAAQDFSFENNMGKKTQVCFSKTTKDFVTGLILLAKKTKYKIFLLRYESQRSINSILLKIPE